MPAGELESVWNWQCGRIRVDGVGNGTMTKVERVEKEIQSMSRKELAAFRAWFQEFDALEWDRQIEKDVRSGKLDKVAESSLQQYESGQVKEL